MFGVGPIIAAMLIGYTGDIGRFANRDHYAAYNGTAPVEFSSGGRTVHRLSQRGNRQLNHALHMAAICQLRQPHSEGRAYFDRKVAEGKTKTRSDPLVEAPDQQRRLPPTRRRRPPRLALNKRAREDNGKRLDSQRGRPHIPTAGSSARSLPDPTQRYAHRPAVDRAAPRTPPNRPLDTERKIAAQTRVRAATTNRVPPTGRAGARAVEGWLCRCRRR